MRKSVLIFLALATLMLLVCGLSWGQCPGEPGDRGTCDTLYVEPYDATGLDVEVALRVTHDLPNPLIDSLSGMVMPLCFTSSNAAANATIDPSKNSCGASDLYPFPDPFLAKSVFRHLPDMATATEHNFMMDLSAAFTGLEWDTRILDVSHGNNAWLSMVATGTQDRSFGPGSRVLVATLTITIEDSTTICIDSCHWPPTGQLLFSNYTLDATTFVPRHNMPSPGGICFPAGPGTGVREIHGSDDSRPSEFALSQNYPNPFNPDTYIEFDLSGAAHVKIDVFNIVGQRVRTLVDEEMEAGRYVADWDGKDEQGNSVSSGIYFYRMQAADFSDMKKMLLVK